MWMGKGASLQQLCLDNFCGITMDQTVINYISIRPITASSHLLACKDGDIFVLFTLNYCHYFPWAQYQTFCEELLVKRGPSPKQKSCQTMPNVSVVRDESKGWIGQCWPIPDFENLFHFFLIIGGGRNDEQPVQQVNGDAMGTQVLCATNPVNTFF